MPRLVWDASGEKVYESGVTNGVLYVEGHDGVAWNGLISVSEDPSGGEPKAYYMDGIKYLIKNSPEEFSATIEAFTYPDEWGACDGTAVIDVGLYATQQTRSPFGLTYKTLVGNDTDGVDHGYKLHFVYNASASPSSRSNQTLTDTPSPETFSWKIETKPVVVSGFKPTAHFFLDSRTTNAELLARIEDLVYGSNDNAAYLPSIDELRILFATYDVQMLIVDNGDGTWTASGPDEMVNFIDGDTFTITSTSSVYLDPDTYTVTTI